MQKITKIGRFSTVKMDLDPAIALQKDLSFLDRNVVKVGVLGNKTGRKESITNKKGVRRAGKQPSDTTNAELGLLHERGSDSGKIPARSWLKMPLTLKNEELNEERKYLLTQLFLKRMTVLEIYKKLGIKAEEIIQRAFASRGFGRWAPNKPSTIARKGSDSPLIDTAQFRQSVSSAVVSK